MPATKIRRPTEKARPELARVRVGVPALPARHVSRARLHAALDDRRQITVVSAPAGFGKTTLLASWLAATAAVDRVAWLAMEEDDDDPLALLGHLIAAQADVAQLVLGQRGQGQPGPAQAQQRQDAPAQRGMRQRAPGGQGQRCKLEHGSSPVMEHIKIINVYAVHDLCS